MKRPTALVALFLLPAFFLLHNYNEIFGFIPISQILVYALIIYGALTAAYLLMLSMKIPSEKSMLILFVISFFILFFSPIHDAYRAITFNSVISHYWVMLPLASLLLLLLARKIIRANNISGKIFTLLNLVLVCLFAIELATAFTKASEYRKNHNLIYPQKPLSDKYVPSTMPDSSKPDIYFFVFDEYTNNRTLKKMWNYDNSEITDWLSANGFHIPSDTHSNYSFTVFSVSSTFNMDYIDKSLGGNGMIIPNLLKANQSLSNNETFSILKKEDYTIRFIAPFNNTIEENGLDHFFDYIIDGQISSQTLPGSLGVTIMSDLKSGALPYFKDSMKFNENLQQKYRSIRLTVDEIKKTTDSSSDRRPHFVYGHILVPHVPHMFDSTGKFLTHEESLSIPLYNTYTAQVNYANSLMKEIVEHIKQHNKTNTIIVIEGDHGFRRFPDSLNKYDLPNFSAIYFPDKDYSRLYDTMSPVNTFRILFDQYFHQNYPMLKDSGTVVKDSFGL